MLRIGGHYSCIYNYDDMMTAIYHTEKAGGNLIQVFNGKNTSTTIKQKGIFSVEDKKKIRQYLKKTGFQIFIHASLTLNFCNPMGHRYQWMMQNFIHDIKWGNDIGASGITVHLGSVFPERYNDDNGNNPLKSMQIAYQNYVKNMGIVVKETKKLPIFIETTAGQKNKIGNTLEELGALYENIENKTRVGICVDTCHIFSAGYKISTIKGFNDYITQFQKLIGINKIKLIHLNDSANPFDSHKDLHTDLMHGYIFKNNAAALKNIVEFAVKNKIPMALETRGLDMYKKEITLVKKLSKK
jgi:deoxyribonuclease-4